MEKIKAKWKVILFVIVLLVILLCILLFVGKAKLSKKVYESEYYKVSYDSTWKKDKDNGFSLEHRKSGSKISFDYKILDNNYMDVDLKNIINDVLYEIEKQNEGYSKIKQNKKKFKYDCYQVLYESEDEQSLVTILKKDNVLMFIVYNATNEYFDILLDNVEVIINNVEIYSGEK